MSSTNRAISRRLLLRCKRGTRVFALTSISAPERTADFCGATVRIAELLRQVYRVSPRVLRVRRLGKRAKLEAVSYSFVSAPVAADSAIQAISEEPETRCEVEAVYLHECPDCGLGLIFGDYKREDFEGS
jgi:hypothetical protein